MFFCYHVTMKVSSYRSPKTEVKKSPIHGRGLFAKKAIKKGELISVKGGHKINRETLIKHRDIIKDAELQIADNLWLAPLTAEEFEENMIFLNHSCEPNVGWKGSTRVVAMRGIAAAEELVLEYATHKSEHYTLICNCKSQKCRRLITGKDWQNKKIQEKYKSFFTPYLQKKINGI